jgi:hypothetical protein
VLTRFTVGQALDELLGEQTEKMSAREILDLTICEPALGSGAFAIEAVRQLAERYLSKRQDELGVRIDPDDYPKQLQRVKAYLALHQVYGVDLNATAVELAEISLWLDTMGEGMDAPWFGLHLRRGNSLIGARRAMFRASQIDKKTWLKDVPEDFPLADVDADLLARDPAAALDGRVHHFLLPAEGWGSAVDVKEAKELAPRSAGTAQDLAEVRAGQADQGAAEAAWRPRDSIGAALAARSGSATSGRAGDPPLHRCLGSRRPPGRRRRPAGADRGSAGGPQRCLRSAQTRDGRWPTRRSPGRSRPPITPRSPAPWRSSRPTPR